MKVYPNPGRDRFSFTVYGLDHPDMFISVYSMTGGLVATIPMKSRTHGIHVAEWNVPGEVSSGFYTYTVHPGSSVASGKLIVLPR
jgi:hypothetical protein